MFGHPTFPRSDSLQMSPDIMSPLNYPLTQLSVSESSFMQRSVSSHSLQKNGLYSHFAATLSDFIDSDSGPVRRVFSTGDLDQGINMGQHQYSRRSESPLSSESNAIIEGMSRACRYSPEEKKERIERYRTKRNLRNFNKKIKTVGHAFEDDLQEMKKLKGALKLINGTK
ncbi:Zinc finger protein CONSTANS-like protein [Corchorus olitorius]|uniref:Zinc finger protein CONSTANS-like protein n=1 Tax=Corchorus olitorius TaxID=93759 RepID=A0A1R3J967_9ROSI|nr:Zinc finger protein CONSTANS-like protein [Corchorus olitorius]